jgi:hypothetical protein
VVARKSRARIGRIDTIPWGTNMADVNTGMEKPDMKRLLMKSKQEPVNCAIGQGDDATIALLLLDKVKAPKSVEKDLAKQFPSARNTRWGTAHVDLELDPKEVRFTVNKPAPGIARKLVKTVKGTGFTKVVIVLEDDGSILEQAGEEEAPATTAAAPQPAPAAAPAPPQDNAAALGQALAELIKRIPAAAPALKARLAQLATEANTNLKAGKLPEAAASITALRQAFDSFSQPATPPAPPPAPAAGGGQTAYAKSRQAWLAARKKIETDLEKLRSEIVATYQEDGSAPELDKRYRDRVAPLLATFDERLADKLGEATTATDPAQHSKLVAEARGIIGEYQTYLDGEPLIGDLDANPFVPLTIKATIGATLAAVSKAVV